MSVKHAQDINTPKAENNQVAKSPHHSFENYQACLGLFIPLKVKEMELLL